MIGDIIEWFKEHFKEQFCIHSYSYTCLEKRCRKCGRIKLV